MSPTRKLYIFIIINPRYIDTSLVALPMKSFSDIEENVIFRNGYLNLGDLGGKDTTLSIKLYIFEIIVHENIAVDT